MIAGNCDDRTETMRNDSSEESLDNRKQEGEETVYGGGKHESEPKYNARENYYA